MRNSKSADIAVRELREEGKALYTAGSFAKALVCFNKALGLTWDEESLYWKGKILSIKSKKNGSKKDAEVAIECFERILRTNPKSKEAWLELGQLHTRRPLKLQCYDAAIQIDPNFAEAILAKGFTLEKSGKSDKALECFRRAEKLFRAQGNTINAGAAMDLITRIEARRPQNRPTSAKWGFHI